MKFRRTSRLIAIMLSILMIVTCGQTTAFADLLPEAGQTVQAGQGQEEESLPADPADETGAVPIVTTPGGEDALESDEPEDPPVLPGETEPDEDGLSDEVIEDSTGSPDDDPAEETESAAYPAFAPEAVKIDDVLVTVSAPEGVFPEGAVLSVEKVTAYEQEQADAAVGEVRGADWKVAVSYTYDIKVLDADGLTELEPVDEAKVKVAFSFAEAADENLDTQVYHLTEDEETRKLSAEKLDILTDESPEYEPVFDDPETTVLVETDGFSFYTVEFTYGTLQYVLSGDSSVPMSEILAAVGLTGEVSAAEVSSSELFSASDETGEWVVTAHRPFESTEWMKVTINDVVYEITVKDDPGNVINNVRYWDHSWDGSKVVAEERTENSVKTVPANGAMTSGWYYLTTNVTVNGRVCLTGDTQLILGDGFTLDVKGLYIPKGSTLKIYGQSRGTGKIYSHPSGGAGIGAYAGHKGGAIEIHGGQIEAVGHDNCAGIGANDDDRKDIGSITIYDGNVKTTGGDSGAGIGGGRACEGGNITIYGGIVTAQGGHYGAGIGGGNGQDTSPMRGAHGGTITIWGGTVNATGGDDGAGIGGGEGGNAGTITINGGTVTAQGGNYSAGIGCGEGESTGVGGSVTINGGTVTATGGKNAAGIGGGEDGHCETITISGTPEGTKVTATGGSNGAGIGAGRDSDGGIIKITGGTVKATGKDSSAGIGGADASDDYADYTNIEISGGDITATGNSKGAGIGGGEYGHATVAITGGTIKAYGGGSGGSAIGNGKDGKGSAITLGYTDVTKKNISITAASWGGIVKLTQPFKNDHYNFRAVNSVSDGDKAKLGDSPLKAWLDEEAPETTVEVSSWTALQNAVNNAAGEITIKLTENISANGEPRIRVPWGKTVTIDLNGKELNRGQMSADLNGHVIEVNAGAVLTITDSADGGRITGGWANLGGGIYIEENAECTIAGGTISGNRAKEKGGGVYVRGTLKMTGGEISGNFGDDAGGILNNTSGTVILNGGAIKNNTSQNHGGGGIVNYGALSLNGGTITGNTAKTNGGGIWTNASVSMQGAVTIQNNNGGAGSTVSNVYLADNGSLITVAEKLDAAALIGVGMQNTANNITSGLKGRGAAANFTSDDTAYTIGTDGAGEAYLSRAADYSVNSWTDLQDKVNKASSGAVIELSGDVVNTENKDRIKIDGSKNIAIDLNGHQLNRNRSSETGDGHVIEVFGGSTLTIRDSAGGGTITGGYAKRGGGIYINENAVCVINGGTITGNKADVDGGGIYVRGTLRMTGGAITYNYADDTGGGIYVTSDGRFNLIGADISQNTADNEGGGLKIHLKEDSAITNCRITYNKSDDEYGGGLHLDADGKTLTITGTVIEHNISDDDGAGIYLRYGTIVMNGGSLSYNTTENDGGGAKITKGTTFTAAGVAITGNTAKKEEGGGVKNFGTTTLRDCVISNNKAKRQGGGVFNDNDDGSKGVLTLENCTITGNSSSNDGGGVYSDKKLTVIGGSITGNTAAGSGGGIFIGDDSDDTNIGGDLIVKDNTVTGRGEDIFLRTHRLAVQSALTEGAEIGITKENDKGIGVFTSGYSQANQNEDPALYFFSPEGLDVVRGGEGEAWLASGWKDLRAEIANAPSGTEFILDKNYTASSADDCLYIPAGKSITIDLAGHTLNRNRTSKDGDGHVIWVKEGATLILKDSTAAGTSPGAGRITGGYSSDGGGIYVDKNAVCTVTGVNITKNKAKDDGAGVYVKGTLSMENCVISYNEADDCGGAIYSENTAKLTLKNVVITRNLANEDDGGALHLYLGQDSSITDCEITYNIAGDCGGGLFLDAEGRKLTIKNTKIDNNTAIDDDGGGVYLMYGTIEMENGSISNNTTAHDSGGIKVTSKTTFTASGVNISGNTAGGEEGGGLKNYGTATLKNCTICGNSAGKEGGGIFNDNDGSSAGELTIDGCTISDNKSNDNGGGIYSDHKLTIKGNTTVGGTKTENGQVVSAGNKAEEKGSGIFIGKDAKYTNIQGKLIIEHNDGTDLYLRSGQVLTLTGGIAGTQIGTIDMDSVGVFTGNYSTYYPAADAGGREIAANAPSQFFCKSASAIPAEWNKEKTEAQLVSYWPEVQKLIDKAAAGEAPYEDHVVVLEKDYTAGSEDVSLEIKEGYDVTIDLNGHTLNRNLRSVKKVLNNESSYGLLFKDVGHVFVVYGGASMTVKDSQGKAGGNPVSDDEKQTGVIMGGYAEKGGGIAVYETGTLKVESGAILGNHAEDQGGGILNYGTLEMTGGSVYGNGAGDNGGGIYSSDSSSLSLANVYIENNTSGDDGAGLNIRLGADEATITNCTITGNGATDYGGGLRFDAKGKTLTITNTTIDNNYSGDDGAGIYLHNGTINMTGGSISDNSSYNDGGGAKITEKTTFTADGVHIENNRSISEEGGGVKNLGTTTLKGCTITGNKARKEGGGVFNNEELTLENCTIQKNTTQDVGGGVYSDEELYLIGGEISGNRAANKGGGVYLGSDSDDTGIEGAVVIKDNEAANFGNDLYLRSGRKLVLTGALTENADGPSICVDLEKGAGVLAKKFKDYHKKDAGEAEKPEKFFAVAVGYDLSVNKDGAVEITSGWKDLKKKIEDAESGTKITLDKNCAAKDSDDRIEIDDDKDITIDLAGYTLNRRRKDETDDGHVFEVFGGSTLTIIDSSDKKTGTIMGGWAERGGGINVHENAVLNLEGGTVTGNRADTNGGGIFVKGTLNMSGGVVRANKTDGSGGGIYLDNSAVLNLTGGRVTDNDAQKQGGGVYVKFGAKANVKGTPEVSENRGTKAGNDVYLPSGCALTVTGQLAEGAKLGVALENVWGPVTSGYERNNAGSDPALYFISTEGYAVYLEAGEAVLGLNTYGKTDDEDPFISANNQINTDPDTLSSQNWMSGISGERLLNEINTPGSHDTGMNNVDKNLNTTAQWISTIGSVIMEAAGALTFALGLLFAPFTGGVSLLVGTQALLLSTAVVFAVNIAIPTDWTSYVSWAADAISADKAKTQKEYIDQQLNEGARQLDIRLNNRKKVYKFVGGGVFNGWTWSDNGEDLWVCHGKAGGGTYLANDDNDDYLSFNQVLEWVKDFLTKHPTETILLDLRPETEKKDEEPTIYERTRKILEQSALQTNPSTDEPFLYKEPGSDDYFAPYTQMPKLADCRGKIVIMPYNDEYLDQIGGFRLHGLTSENLDELNYQNTQEEMADQIRDEYAKANGDGHVKLAADADDHDDRMWYWEMNCTGQKAGYPKYIFKIGAPHELAEYVNEETFGDGKVFSSDLTGQYIGWVRLDSFQAKYAEIIWRTNFHDKLEYCTVTVESGLDDAAKYPAQTYKVLKGTDLTIPGSIYKNVNTGCYFDCWQADDGTVRKQGETYTVNDDVTFTAQWLEAGKIPVSIVWKDADDADKLREESVGLNVSVNGRTSGLTLTREDGWSGIITANQTDTVAVTPDCPLVVITEEHPQGQDAEGQYRYEVTNEPGTGYVITLIHTPQGTVPVSGTVAWAGDDAEKRPGSVTVHLFRGDEEAAEPVTVTAEGGWTYDFGTFAKYADGEELAYTVTEDEVAGYSTVIDGFAVTNTYVPDKLKTISVTGAVYWDDGGDAKHIRPGGVNVTMLADGEVADTQDLKETRGEIWIWNFYDLAKTDAAGNTIKYTIKEEPVPGYTMTWERITADDPEDASAADGESEDDMSYMYQITYTLDVTEEEKTPAAVSAKPDPMELTWTGKEQTLVKEGEAEGGQMLYAPGDSAETAPDPSAYGTELPAGTEPGTYYVWYYVRGDILHTDTEAQCVTAVIDKAEPEVTAPEVKEDMVYNGREQVLIEAGETTGGTLVYAVTTTETEPEDDRYAEELPAAEDTGSYYVWYKVIGEGYYRGTEPVCLEEEAVIAKKEAAVAALAQTVRLNGTADTSVSSAVLLDAVEGHTLSAVTLTAGSTEHAGTVPITPSAAKIADADGTDVTANYEITYQDGVLTVCGKVVYVRQNRSGTWPQSAAGSEPENRPGTGGSFAVTDEVANRYRDDHYRLKGWSTAFSSDGSCTAVTAGQTINGLQDADFLFLYYELENYRLTFYADAEGKEVWKTETVYYGKSVSDFAGEVPPARENETFACWASESVTGIDSYTEKDEITINPALAGKQVDWERMTLTEDTAVYPVWIHDRLEVHLDLGADDAVMDGIQERVFTVNLGEKVVMRYLITAARPGYELAGWYTQSGVLWNGAEWQTLPYAAEGWEETAGWGVTPEYCDKDAEGNDIIHTNEARKYDYYTVTLTAHWVPKEASVKYALGDHAAQDAVVPESVIVTFGGTVILAEAPDAENGWIFTGWEGPDGQLYSAGGTYHFDNWAAQDNPAAPEGNTLTFTAQYEEKARVTLTFDAAGGTAVAPLTDYEGDTVNLDDPQFATTRKGYAFAGWYNSANEKCEGEYLFTANETLTAHWTVKQYTITFDSAGGSEVAPITQDYDTAVDAPEAPEKEHYTFAGWVPALPERMPADNLAVKASWAPVSYKIFFDTDGGSGIETIEDIYGAPVTAPEAPTKEGCTFAGWLDESGNPVMLPAYMPDTNPTFTAKWMQNQEVPEISVSAADAYTVRVNDPAEDTEYLLVPAGQAVTDQSWGSAKRAEGGSAEWGNLHPASDYDVWARRFATDDKNASEAVKASVTTPKEEQAAPAAPTVKEVSADTVVIGPVTDGAEYALVEKGTAPVPEDAWQSPNAEGEVKFEGLIPNTEYEAYGRMKANERQRVSEPSAVTEVKTGKRKPEVTAPKAKEDLVYNGREQALVEAGTTTGGTLVYAVGLTAAAAPVAARYTEAIPAAKNAGTYYVWYKVLGDDQYNGTSAARLGGEIVIAKKAATVEASAQTVGISGSADTSVGKAVLLGAADGHTLEAVTLTAGSTEHAGQTQITPTAARIADADGLNVTGNYDITYKDGILTVQGQVVYVRQTRSGAWPENAAGAEKAVRPGTGESFAVTDEIAGLYAEDHYLLKGYSTAWMSGDSCTAVSAGQTINGLQDTDFLFLFYELENHTLTFYADTEGTEAWKTETVYFGSTLSRFRTEEPPAREHETFAAWATESVSGIDGYTEKDEETLNPALAGKLVNWDRLTLTEDTAVYPVWIHDRLEVNLDLGARDAVMDEAQETFFTVDLGEKVAMRYLIAAERPGYELAGWYTQSGVLWNGEEWKTLPYAEEGWEETAGWGVTPEYCDKDAEGNDILQTNEVRKFDYYTVTLTAHWIPKEASVLYALGDHAAPDAVVPESAVVIFGGTVLLAEAPEAENGWVFTGWEGPDGQLYSAGGTFQFDSWETLDDPEAEKPTLTFTAQYEEKAKVTLTFDAAGGTAVAPLTDYEGDTVNLDDPQFATARKGYDFAGWYNSANEKCEGEYLFTANETLTAHWTVKQFTLTFDSAGGSEVAPITQDYDTVIDAPAAPEKEHYTFAGWVPAIPERMPAEDLTVKASWAPASYRIFFDTDGGSEIGAIEDIYGAPVTAPEDPTKEGFTFAGWLDENGELTALPAYMPDTNPTFTAKWMQDQKAPELGADAVSAVDAHTVRVNDPADDTEYLLVPAGQTPADKDWADAKRSEDGSVEWDSLLPAEDYDVWARRFAAEDKNASEAVKVSVTTPKEDQAAPSAPIVKETAPDAVVIGPVADGAEYALVEKGTAPVPEDAWVTPDENGEVRFEGLTPGTEYEAYGRMKANEKQNASEPSAATEVKTGKLTPEVTAPTAKEGLVYNGEKQALIEAGETTGGNLVYAVTKTSAAPADTQYTEEIPAAEETGSYVVWYKVVGDDTYSGTEPVRLADEIVIAQKAVTVEAAAQVVDLNAPADTSVSSAVLLGAVDGHTLKEVTLTAGSTEHAGKKQITPSGAKIIDADGADVTDNYEITYKDGALTVRGQVVFVRQNSDGTWPESAEGSEAAFRPGTGESFAVTEEAAARYGEDHYFLKGYGTAWSNDGSCTAITAGQNINGLQDADFLYLYYELENHRVTLYADTEGTEVWRTETVYYGQSLAQFADAVPPARENETFACWATESLEGIDAYTEPDGTTLNPALEGKLVDWDTSALTEDLEAYPVWIHDRLEVQLDLGAADAAMDEEQALTFTVDLDEKVVMRYLIAAERPGYELAGWYTQSGVLWNGEEWQTLPYVTEGWEETAGWGVTPEYCDKDAEGNDIIQTNEARRFSYYTVTLTAEWLPKEAVVKYAPGEHVAAGSAMPAEASVFFDGTVNLAAAPEAENGWVFTGWEGPDGQLYSAEGTYHFDSWETLDDPESEQPTLTFTAQYEEKAKVTLTFDAAGGTAVAPLTDYEGDTVNLDDPQFATTRKGYTFAGWYNSANEKCEGEYLFTANETLTAHWTVKQFTLTFDSAGGSGVAPITQDYDTVIEAPAAPEKEHYSFTGWVPALPEKMPAENLTAKAGWAPVSYQIFFDTDGGSEIGAIGDIYGAPVTAPEDPTKEGCTFAGWTDGTGKLVTLPAYMPDTNPTFKAKWKQNQEAPELGADAVSAVDAHTIEVNNPADDTEYLLLPAGQTPTDKDWANAKRSEDGSVAWDNLLPASGYDVWARRFATEDKNVSEAAKVSVTTPKEDQAAPSAPIVKEVSADTVVVGPVADGAEYALVEKGTAPVPEDAWTTPDENGEVKFAGLTPGTEYEVYGRMKGGDKQNVSEPSAATEVMTAKGTPEVTAPEAKEGLVYTGEAQALVTAGAVTGGTLVYAVTTAETAPADDEYAEEIPTAADAGTYCVWYKAVGNASWSGTEAAWVEAEIAKADAELAAPVAKEGLVYTGEAQELIDAGSTEDGTLLYALSEDETTEPEEGAYSTEIPAGTAAGTYYVWYRVEGDKNHNDTAAEMIEAVISETEPVDPIVAFVTRLYRVCLEREPDEGGLNDWVSQLRSGAITGVKAAQGFIFSQEFKNKNYCNKHFVQQLYRAFMGREPDEGGWNDWIGRLESGKTREEVFNGFALSPEFTNLCNEYGITRGNAIGTGKFGTVPTGPCQWPDCGEEDGVTAFVKRLYNVALNREAEPGGLADWTGQLWAHTNTGKGVAKGFIFSAEFTARNLTNEEFVDCMYRTFFDREADAAGRTNWVRQLNRGTSRLSVFNGFADSAEFTNLCLKFGILAR